MVEVGTDPVSFRYFIGYYLHSGREDAGAVGEFNVDFRLYIQIKQWFVQIFVGVSFDDCSTASPFFHYTGPLYAVLMHINSTA